MNAALREARADDAPSISQVVQAGFLAHVAREWELSAQQVELNSSPYAVPAYRALGFFPISEPFRRQGAVATRMACWLPGRALARAQNAAQPFVAPDG